MNERKLWFKAKRFGYGWTPATWQGWASTFIYVLIIALEFIKADKASYSVSDAFISFFAPFILITLLFAFLTWGTGEKPKWSWGNK